MNAHKLKTTNPYFNEVWERKKTFEVRNNDRGFKVFDRIQLLEYEPDSDSYTGRKIYGQITYLLKDYDYVKEGYVVFGFKIRMRIPG